jgi:hypothetical protein
LHGRFADLNEWRFGDLPDPRHLERRSQECCADTDAELNGTTHRSEGCNCSPFFIDFVARQTERLACFAMGERKVSSKKHPNVQKVDAEYFTNLRKKGKSLFSLGQVYATPAVLAHLEKHAMYPSALLGPHCHGEYGQLDEEDRQANDDALIYGGRILSVAGIENERIYIITDAADEQGVRHATTLLFPREY